MSFARSLALIVQRVVDPIEGMHRAIARPWFSALGSIGRPPGVVHDSIARLVYGSVRVGAGVLGAAFDGTHTPRLERLGMAAVNGLWGDSFGPREHRLAIPMAFHDDDGVAVDPLSVGHDVAEATGRIVVLVHGLLQTEDCWSETDGDSGQSLMTRLTAHSDLTPLTLRYNTGLAVDHNGERLSSLLDEIHRHWPVPVESIALVGFSMGGLVVQSAYEAAVAAEMGWVAVTNDLVTIASPHRGAPLERFAGAVSRVLAVAPQTQPLAVFLDSRSLGIKNLGSRTEPRPAQLPPDGLRQHTVAGVVTSTPKHPIGSLVGDLMVRPASALGGSSDNAVTHGGVHHFRLLADPDVIDTVMGFLDSHTD